MVHDTAQVCAIAACVCADMVNYSMYVCWLWFVAAHVCADMVNHSMC